MTRNGWRADRDRRRYRRAVRRAFATVTFYREQCAAAGRLLAEPVPTPAGALPEPPHTLCPFARPWSAGREPSLWTPAPRPLARALWLAGCRDRSPVLEVREALLDRTRLARRSRLRRPVRYGVLLSPTALVTSPEHRAALNRAAAVVAAAGTGWLVASPAELAAEPAAGGGRLRPVHRLPVAAAAQPGPVGTPTVLHEPRLGYLGAYRPSCGRFHLDTPRVYARDRDGQVSLSLPGSRRPTLLDIVPAGADQVTLGRCEQHRTAVLLPRTP
jgi:hypothetical protein